MERELKVLTKLNKFGGVVQNLGFGLEIWYCDLERWLRSWLKALQTCTDAGLLGRIQDLYPLVYQKPEMTNNSIAVRFACGILAERKGFTVNSTRFAEQV